MTDRDAPATLALLREFPDRRILLEDDDLVAIDKPCGLSTHAAEESRHDDVVSWLAGHYSARGLSAYLGIHQRLDKETSGVLLFARRKEANASLARQFEGRTVDKTYVAVVEGRVPERRTLRHFLGPTEGGLRVARRPGSKLRGKEQETVTELVTLRRAGKRALVELVPKTGRTHQLRAQLAALGAPIVGDEAYGGAPDTRMMLHARSLVLLHPTSGAKLSLTTELPAELERALGAKPVRRPETEAEIVRAFTDAVQRRVGIFEDGVTTAARVVDDLADLFPGITIDLYGRHAVLSVYEEIPREQIDRIANATLTAGVLGVYLKIRPKHASRIADTRREEVAPATPIAGAAADEPQTILENGVRYEVRLGDGLSTGIFLDQRENRRRVRELANARTVLNLFAYTGAFSIVAALGGARATTTVDIGHAVTEWSQRNFAHNGVSLDGHEWIESDVFAFLTRARHEKKTWDVVIVDPPSFATTKKTTFSAEEHYADLAAACLHVVAPGGKLLACTNHRGISIAQLRKHLHTAAATSRRKIAQMKNLPSPPDFPPPPGREPHLKSVLVTLA